MRALALLPAALAAALLPALALAQERVEPASGYRWLWLAAFLAIFVAMVALFFRAPRRGPRGRPPPARRASGA